MQKIAMVKNNLFISFERSLKNFRRHNLIFSGETNLKRSPAFLTTANILTLGAVTSLDYCHISSFEIIELETSVIG